MAGFEEHDLSPVAEMIMAAIADWFFLDHSLGLEDIEDCAGEAATELYRAGLLSVRASDDDRWGS